MCKCDALHMMADTDCFPAAMLTTAHTHRATRTATDWAQVLYMQAAVSCICSCLRQRVAVQAIKEDYEVVICDTSGRLHTNIQLMDELAKCRKSIGKRMSQAPQETLLVLDGTTGIKQNRSLSSLAGMC